MPFYSQEIDKLKVNGLVMTFVSKLIRSCSKGVRKFCMLLGCVVILAVFTELPNKLFKTYAAHNQRLLITEKERLV